MIDAALLFEADWDEICRHTLFVDCPRELRIARAAERGWSESELFRREAAQMPIEEKKARASYILPNGGSPAELEQEVDRFWRQVVAPVP